MSATNGYVAWNELMTRDIEAAKTYYAKLCGWTYHPMKMPGGQAYFVALLNGEAVAGIMDTTDIPAYDKLAAHWFTYVGVADVDGEVAALEDMGGEVLRHPIDVPNIGRTAMVKDPGGAMVGMIAELPQPEDEGADG